VADNTVNIIFNAGNNCLLLVVGHETGDNRIIIAAEAVGVKESRLVTGQFLKG
jgi:hypothetical protein